MSDKMETLMQQLYDCASMEMDDYLSEMKTRPPEEIISSAYQIASKQDILMILEDAEFSPYELEVLMKLDHPLQVLYEEWVSTEDHHMDDLRGSMQTYLSDYLRFQADKLYADPAVPRYEGLYREASEKGELHLYRASWKRDLVCINAFTQNISEANEKRRMREFVQEWTKEFGYDRCKFLLGYTVQRNYWDGRYSSVSKRGAAKFDYRITSERDPYSEFGTNAHPCLVNYAFELLLEQERTRQKSAPRHDQPER